MRLYGEIIPELKLKLGDYLSIQTHKPCSISPKSCTMMFSVDLHIIEYLMLKIGYMWIAVQQYYSLNHMDIAVKAGSFDPALGFCATMLYQGLIKISSSNCTTYLFQ